MVARILCGVALLIACSILPYNAANAGGIVGIGGGGVVAATTDSASVGEIYIVAGWLTGENDSYGFGARAVTRQNEIVDGRVWLMMKFAEREYIRLEFGHANERFTLAPTVGISTPVSSNEHVFVLSEVALNVGGGVDPDATVTAGIIWKAFQ